MDYETKARGILERLMALETTLNGLQEGSGAFLEIHHVFCGAMEAAEKLLRQHDTAEKGGAFN